jgi:hypothetical protein
MRPFDPYIDEQTGQRFYNVRQAAQIVEGVTQGTMWNWAKKGVTSFGFELRVEQEPMKHVPRAFRHDAKTHRETRMLIPEQKVLALKQILQEAGRTRPGPWTRGELATLEAVAYRHRASVLALHHYKRLPAPNS